MSMKPTYEGLTMNQVAECNADLVTENEKLKKQLTAVVAESLGLKELIEQHAGSIAVCPNCSHEEPSETDDIIALYRSLETPAADACLADVRAQGA